VRRGLLAAVAIVASTVGVMVACATQDVPIAMIGDFDASDSAPASADPVGRACRTDVDCDDAGLTFCELGCDPDGGGTCQRHDDCSQVDGGAEFEPVCGCNALYFNTCVRREMRAPSGNESCTTETFFPLLCDPWEHEGGVRGCPKGTRCLGNVNSGLAGAVSLLQTLSPGSKLCPIFLFAGTCWGLPRGRTMSGHLVEACDRGCFDALTAITSGGLYAIPDGGGDCGP
jgi:hypothetical protein